MIGASGAWAALWLMTASPAPPIELAALDPFVGRWECEGTDETSESAPARPFRSTITIKRDLGGFWFAGRHERGPSRRDREHDRRLFFWSYDPLQQGFVGGWLDSHGQWSTQTSTGWHGDHLAMMGHVTSRGAKASAREMFTRPKDGRFQRSHERLDFNTWVRLSEETCRRR